MRINVKHTVEDFLTNTTEVIAEGEGVISGHRVTYAEPEMKFLNTVTITDGEVHILRRGEETTEITFPKTGRGKCHVKSSVGVMELETELLNLNIRPDTWTITYRMFLNGEIVTHRRMILTFRGYN